jgi:hypothetical protein
MAAETTTAPPGPAPLWARENVIEKLFGLTHHHLRRLASSGLIRHRKLGDYQRGTHVYKVSDIAEFLDSDQPFPGGLAMVPAGAVESAAAEKEGPAAP